jgi:hypothetical protein
MIEKKKYIIIVIAVIFSLKVSAGEYIYVVKKGETLSSILFDQNLEPIYGKKGNLKKILKLNLIVNDGNKIFPGKIIKLFTVKSENKIFEVKATPKENEIRVGTAPASIPESELLIPTTNLKTDFDHEQYIFIRFAPQISWMKVSSKSTNEFQKSSINTLSKASPGLIGNYGINISEKYNIQAFTYLSQVNFYQVENYQLSKNSFLRQAYGLGSDYHLDPINRFSFKIGFFDEFFLTTNDKMINVETAQIPEAHWGYRRILGQYKNVTLDSGLFGKFIIPYNSATINGQFGYGLGGDLLLMFKNKGLRFFYNYSNAEAKNKTTKTLELGWNIVFEGKIFE